MSTFLKVLFLIYAVIAFIFGAPLLLAPGKFLGVFGWAPVDPLLSRLLGAALLGMAWSSLRSFRLSERSQARLVIETNLIFCALGSLGFLRHLTAADYYPFMVWFVFGLLVVFTLAWLIALLKK